MSRHFHSHDAPAPHTPSWRRGLRVAGLVLLAAVLGVAFLGHLSPDMQLQWENLMALCGF